MSAHAGTFTLRLDYSAWALTVVVVFVSRPALVDRLRPAARAPGHPAVPVVHAGG